MTKLTKTNYIKALGLAVNMLSLREPGDSRAVSDEFVALAAVYCGMWDPTIELALDKGIEKYKKDPTP